MKIPKIPKKCMLTICAALILISVIAPTATANPSPGFYTTVPSNLAQLAPGTLIKSEPESMGFFTNITFSSAYRIMYRSTGQLGGAIAVTGMVFVPYGTAPSGGWPIVTWDHGTTGVGPSCTPSMYGDMYDNSNWHGYSDEINFLLTLGYAVVAPDYEGLGPPPANGTFHTYLQANALGQVTIDSVRAVGQVVSSTSKRWASVGHSEGGMASVATGELAATTYGQGLTYLGAVALAPVQHLYAQSYPVDTTATGAPYYAYMAAGMLSINPSFVLTNFLGPLWTGTTPPNMAQAEQDCFTQWFRTDNKNTTFTANGELNPNGPSDPTVQTYFANSNIGMRKSAGPILVAQGTNDSLYSTYPQFIQDECTTGNVVHGITYQNATHTSVIPKSQYDVQVWLSNLFAGVAEPNDCH
jgi:pimeloyl-ACP methyl ester carboxylesterase